MRGVTRFLLTLIVGLALLWLGFWWYAQGRLEAGFTDWASRQAGNGWKISYASIARGTSPLDAAVVVRGLSLALPPDPAGRQFTIALPAVTLRIQALNPLVFHTDLPNRIAINANSGLGLVLNIGNSAVAENLDPNALFKRGAELFRSGDFSANNVDVLLSAGSLLALHLDAISSHDTFNPGAGANADALSGRTSVDGLAVSPLVARIAGLPFDGKLTHLDAAVSLTGPLPPNLQDTLNQLGASDLDLQARQRLIVPIAHRWAAGGGSGKAVLNLTLGPSTMAAAARLGFDADLQPAGTADLAVSHLDQFTAALAGAYPALQPDIAQAEAENSQYLADTATGGQTLSLHLVYGHGGIVINGQKRADMPPLNWDAAENPPPPPPAAPMGGNTPARPD